ncbi:membrane-associated progesterone receptor component protein [Dioscorea alata]|uniref:Membrane-associated progesterone receptor component protein n=1 Tax=Dioscorea alata TaxID=55571 RepID=A0ACB7WRH9_DIOAL|nr:membrane-associated progesterone receptor component protein [Dioscorea alata]
MAIGELWESLNKSIVVYTGLSPTTFFTALAIAGAVYFAVSSLFSRPEPVRSREVKIDEPEPLPPPVQLGEITEEELRVYDGSDPKKPLLMAIKGQIYDVTQSRMFYGPGGPYALFAGKDASRALAKMSFEEQDLTGDISALGPFELEALQDWEYKFMSKYVKVGTVKKTITVPVDEPAEITSLATENNPDHATPVHEAEAEHCSESGPVEHVEESKEHISAARSAEVEENAVPVQEVSSEDILVESVEMEDGRDTEVKEHIVSGHVAEAEDGYDAETKKHVPVDHTVIPREEPPAKHDAAEYVTVEDIKE